MFPMFASYCDTIDLQCHENLSTNVLLILVCMSILSKSGWRLAHYWSLVFTPSASQGAMRSCELHLRENYKHDAVDLRFFSITTHTKVSDLHGNLA
ncbi:hypothetical protein ACJX0J_041135, partial [Zea mays]